MSHPAPTKKVVAVCRRHDEGFLVNVPVNYTGTFIVIGACDLDLGEVCELTIVGSVNENGTYTCSEHDLYDISMSPTAELTYHG